MERRTFRSAFRMHGRGPIPNANCSRESSGPGPVAGSPHAVLGALSRRRRSSRLRRGVGMPLAPQRACALGTPRLSAPPAGKKLLASRERLALWQQRLYDSRSEEAPVIRLLAVSAGVIALVGTIVAQAPAQRPDPRTIQLRGNRFKPLKYDEMTPAQKTMVEHLIAGPRGGVNGPFNVLLRSPEIGDLGQEFGASTRFKSSLPQRLYE